MKTVCRLACSMLLVCFAAFIFAGCAKTPPKAEPVAPPADEAKIEAKKIIVAKVNGSELTMDQLITLMNRLAERSDGQETMEEHKKRALDKLVLQELAYQQAKTKGLKIGTDKIDMAIDNLKANMTEGEDYNEYLKQHNFTEPELRTQIERSLLIELDYAREVLDKVTVPEAQVRAEYERVKHLFVQPEKVSALDVFIIKNEGKVSQKKANELLKKIKADPNKDPWKLTLDGTFILRNIEIKKDREPELYKAAKKLKPEELSGVIKAQSGFHIIKLRDYSPERQLTFDETKSRLEGRFMVAAQEKRTQEWEEELKKGANIELMLDTEKQKEQKTAEPGQAVQK
jgi:parvulin-like peptidyl-prolyl isomerase